MITFLFSYKHLVFPEIIMTSILHLLVFHVHITNAFPEKISVDLSTWLSWRRVLPGALCPCLYWLLSWPAVVLEFSFTVIMGSPFTSVMGLYSLFSDPYLLSWFLVSARTYFFPLGGRYNPKNLITSELNMFSFIILDAQWALWIWKLVSFSFGEILMFYFFDHFLLTISSFLFLWNTQMLDFDSFSNVLFSPFFHLVFFF